MSIITFFRDNHNKMTSIEAFVWSGFFQFALHHVSMKKLQPMFGHEGEETEIKSLSDSDSKEAHRISYVINHVCSHTPWESKCLVRALTAQRMLKKRGMMSTMYLGLAMENEQMVAHAWIRCGDFYLTGGLGTKYTIVSRFRI